MSLCLPAVDDRCDILSYLMTYYQDNLDVLDILHTDLHDLTSQAMARRGSFIKDMYTRFTDVLNQQTWRYKRTQTSTVQKGVYQNGCLAGVADPHPAGVGPSLQHTLGPGGAVPSMDAYHSGGCHGPGSGEGDESSSSGDDGNTTTSLATFTPKRE